MSAIYSKKSGINSISKGFIKRSYYSNCETSLANMVERKSHEKV